MMLKATAMVKEKMAKRQTLQKRIRQWLTSRNANVASSIRKPTMPVHNAMRLVRKGAPLVEPQLLYEVLFSLMRRKHRVALCLAVVRLSKENAGHQKNMNGVIPRGRWSMQGSFMQSIRI